MPNVSSQGCKSVPPCKILKFKHWLRPPKSRIKTTPCLDNATIGQPRNWMTLHFGRRRNAAVGERRNTYAFGALYTTGGKTAKHFCKAIQSHNKESEGLDKPFSVVNAKT